MRTNSHMRLTITATLAVTLAVCGPVQAATHKPKKPPRTTTTIAVAVTAPAPRPDTTASEQATRTPIEWASELVNNITDAQTDYDHGIGPVTWSGSNGATLYESRTDCSGFILALYQQAYKVTPARLGTWLGKKRPLAANFVDAINAGHGYAAVTNISDVQPGDLIAVRYLNPGQGDNTGHLLLVESAPAPHTASKPFIDGTSQWDVAVIDQSSTGHGPTDTRHHPDKTFAPGIGRGTIRIYTDFGGTPAGYAWSDITVSPYYPQAERPLIIGRLDPTHAW